MNKKERSRKKMKDYKSHTLTLKAKIAYDIYIRFEYNNIILFYYIFYIFFMFNDDFFMLL